MNKIFLRDLRRAKPSIVDVWRILDENDDINKVREFFSYEHFYVLYCKFWELDVDHDFLLDREDLLRYDSHAFSRKAIDRIFSQIPAKYTITFMILNFLFEIVSTFILTRRIVSYQLFFACQCFQILFL